MGAVAVRLTAPPSAAGQEQLCVTQELASHGYLLAAFTLHSPASGCIARTSAEENLEGAQRVASGQVLLLLLRRPGRAAREPNGDAAGPWACLASPGAAAHCAVHAVQQRDACGAHGQRGCVPRLQALLSPALPLEWPGKASARACGAAGRREASGLRRLRSYASRACADAEGRAACVQLAADGGNAKGREPCACPRRQSERARLGPPRPPRHSPFTPVPARQCPSSSRTRSKPFRATSPRDLVPASRSLKPRREPLPGPSAQAE
jgi:hypothetical protein